MESETMLHTVYNVTVVWDAGGVSHMGVKGEEEKEC